MTPILKESTLAIVRRLEWADLFPVPREFREALSWRGPELHVNSRGFTVFRRGGPDHDLLRQSADFCETVVGLKNIIAGSKRICLSLDKALVLTSSVDIPFASDGMTEQILALRRSQEIPAEPSDYMHGWFDDPVQPNGSTRHVVDVVVRREMVERIFSQLRDLGTACEMIFVRNGLGPALPIAWDGNGFAYKQNEIKTWIKRTWLSMIGVGIAGIFAIAALLNQQDSTINRIDEKLMALQPEAKRVAKQAHANDALLSQVALLVDLTSPSQLASVQLEELAKLLPDAMVLTAFRFDSGSIVLEGFATAPEQLIELLSKQKNVSNVAFSAPVFRNPGETKSRFVVSFSLAGRSK